MPLRRGRKTTNPAESVDSIGGSVLGGNILERLIETLSMGTSSRPLVEQARRLGATSFHGTIDSAEALS